MHGKVTISQLQQMKREGQKSVGLVAWDYQMARIADRAGIDFISVGDSVGVNLWGRSDVLDVTLEEMLICCKAVRRGTVRALVDAGIPVFAQFGLTPQTASKYGIPYSAQNLPTAQASAEAAAKLVEEAKLLEAAGACLLDFTNSGPIAGAAVAAAVQIPVIGGFGGGPWLDGRVRLAHTAIGYGEKWLDATTETYANTAKAALAAFAALIADARAGRQIKG